MKHIKMIVIAILLTIGLYIAYQHYFTPQQEVKIQVSNGGFFYGTGNGSSRKV